MEKKQPSHHRFTFGPVPSRRLGRSLGIDLVPFKTCTYDCIYCQLGRTTNKTTTREAFFPVEDILTEILRRLEEIPKPDYITLSGSGEPTLHCGMKNIIHDIKKITDIPVAVLTNGSLFWIEEVRSSVQGADLIIPSLDAGSKESFYRINRPHSDITFEKMVEGLCSLRKDFKGPIWLEVFMVKGLNNSLKELSKIKYWCDHIEPQCVQLNTAVRTPAEAFVEPVARQELEKIKTFFGPDCEVIPDYSDTMTINESCATEQDVLELLKRRPCSIEDIAFGLNIHRNEAIKYVHKLISRGFIKESRHGKKMLYHARNSGVSSKE
jgi:wyosine [tRNA(Phe)-imidazoG37] synthetase (radical SAM superfamily)